MSVISHTHQRLKKEGWSLPIRGLARTAFLICIPSLLVWIGYVSSGHKLIKLSYQAPATGFLSRVLEGREFHLLERYLEIADSIIWQALFWLILLSWIGYGVIIRKKYTEFCLVVCSSILTVLIIFVSLEISPGLIETLNLDRTPVSYYRFKNTLIKDSELVFRARPLYRYQFTHSIGRAYDRLLGVPPFQWSVDRQNDALGFMNPIGREREPSDVIVLGDSFMNVSESNEDTFDGLLQDFTGLSTYNLSAGGYGPYQYLALLKRFGLSRHAKYAIFAFFEGNDLSNILQYRKWKEGKSRYQSVGILHESFVVRFSFVLKEVLSWFVTEIHHILEEFRRQTGKWIGLGFVQSREEGKVHPRLTVFKLAGEKHFDVFGRLNEAPSEEILASASLRYLKEILIDYQRTSEEAGMTPILLFIPTKVHVYAPFTTNESGYRWNLVREKQIASKENLQDSIASVCKELGIKYLNLTPVLEAAGQKGSILYYPFDAHWNREGRRIAAEYVGNTLLDLLNEGKAE